MAKEIIVRLLENDKIIMRKILKGMASKANERLLVTLRKSRLQIVDYIESVILNTPEMKELQNGKSSCRFYFWIEGRNNYFNSAC